MNVGVIVDNDLTYDKRVLREIDILKASGHKVFILCFGFLGQNYTAIVNNYIIRIKILKKTKDILFFFQNCIPLYEWLWSSHIKRFISNFNIEVLHVHDLYMAKAAYSGKQKAKLNIPLILDLHENFPYVIKTYNWTKGLLRSLITKPGKWELKEKEYLGYATRIIVLSEDFKEILVKKYQNLDIRNFSVLPNMPDLAEGNTDSFNTHPILFIKTSPVILYFGVIAERRGIFDALDVFSEIVKDGADAQLLLIGPVDKKDKRKFHNIIDSKFFNNQVIYIPWIDISELPAYLQESDICIAPLHKNPQHESGVANKIFDYMLGHKPIVASDCKPQQRIIEKHDCGLIFSNKEEFKDAILRLLTDAELRQKMGVNGYNAVVKYYSLSVIKKDLIAVYESLK